MNINSNNNNTHHTTTTTTPQNKDGGGVFLYCGEVGTGLLRCRNSVWEIAVDASLYARLRWKVAADLQVDLLAGLAHRLLETAINGKLPRVAENGFEVDLQKITLMVLWITCRLSQRRSSIGVFRLGVDLQNGWLV